MTDRKPTLAEQIEACEWASTITIPVPDLESDYPARLAAAAATLRELQIFHDSAGARCPTCEGLTYD